jgi:hypothetical protein
VITQLSHILRTLLFSLLIYLRHARLLLCTYLWYIYLVPVIAGTLIKVINVSHSNECVTRVLLL